MNGTVYLYRDRASKSGRALAKALGIRLTRATGSRFKPDRATQIVNWGCATGPDHPGVLNSFESVGRSVDKKLCWDMLGPERDVRIPKVLTESEATERLALGKRVVCRSHLRASGGYGIEVCSPGTPLPTSLATGRVRAYTAYIPKRAEYRIHCARGVGIFHVQQKRRRRDSGDGEIDSEIRNAKNGWVFCHLTLDPPVPIDVQDHALAAFRVSGLDFGAIDVIWNEAGGKAWVLEINTAPGLEGTTLEKYTEAIGGLLRG